MNRRERNRRDHLSLYSQLGCVVEYSMIESSTSNQTCKDLFQTFIMCLPVHFTPAVIVSTWAELGLLVSERFSCVTTVEADESSETYEKLGTGGFP